MWQFRVKAQYQSDFEKHYGPDGSWERLFRKAPDYVSTQLLRDATNRLQYLTVDRWQSRKSYEAFRQMFSTEYSAIDSLCNDFTESEESLGKYDVA
jgi:heme-degrading monooxygenase HmoA